MRVKGKKDSVAIVWPVAPADRLEEAALGELKVWAAFLKAYRAQDWEQCDVLMLNLHRMGAKKYLYEMYSERVASMRVLPSTPDGTAPPISRPNKESMGPHARPRPLPAASASASSTRLGGA